MAIDIGMFVMRVLLHLLDCDNYLVILILRIGALSGVSIFRSLLGLRFGF